MPERTCSVEGCKKPRYAKTLCELHYGREYRKRRLAHMPVCSVDGCDKPQTHSGLCSGHNGTARRERLRRSGAACSVEGCAKAAFVVGLCDMHYQRKRLKGDVGGPDRIQGKGWIDAQGYRVRYVPGGGVALEHRLVMEQVLGRTLADYESVHHKNGRRADNRPNNLELWVKPQPAGQRPEDLVAWVVDHYRDLVIEAL